jgi:RNA polymerase sigma factor (sigma-70 family)
MRASADPELPIPDQQLLAELFESSRPRLLAWVQGELSARLAARIDPEGVLQNAFIRARDRWTRAQNEVDRIDLWLSRMVHDQLVEEIRAALGPSRNFDREAPLPDNSADHILLHLFGTRSSPTESVRRRERRDLVRNALKQLGARDTEILTLFAQGFSYKEIGLLMDMKENSANRRCLRALEKLGDFLPPRSALF